ncbi:choice-of-anchor G family protein [Pseudarthrobacter sp. NamE2]|uniref:choice-of-anchor G family protein n=1 Tax=Pseudarthrobacter sp. NamE2 TaxID=2576838 RepID=UPI0010FF4269|nr:choice-of-anchor G family protein [Pseudarthrobacter sp. NamE2]TLM86498.1 choice-of-anchor G family protein [Pseudarthrobacter sp. NamE2]
MTAAAGQLRRGLLMGGIMAASLAVTGTTLTNAAWTDNEYVHAHNVGTDGRCEQDSGTTTTASARQLSGTLLNSNLDSVAALHGLSVTNDGAGTSTASANAIRINPDTFMAPLDASALNTDLLQLSLPLGLPVGSADVYSQWGQTLNNGNTTAASGLITDSGGALGLGQTQNPDNPPVMATLNLGAVIPTALAGITLDVGAASSIAELTYCGDLGNGWQGPLPDPLVERSYQASALNLNADMPTLDAAAAGADTLLRDVNSKLQAAQPGLSAAVAQDLIAASTPLLGGLDSLTPADVETEVKLDLSQLDLTAAKVLLTSTMTDAQGLITVDFGSGVARINLAKAEGGINSLNGKAPNTKIALDQDITNQLSTALTQVLDTWRAKVITAVQQAIRATPASVTATVTVRSLGIPVGEIGLGLGPVTTGQLLDLHYGVPGTPVAPVTTSLKLLVLSPPITALDTLASGLAAALPFISGKALHNGLILGVVETLNTSLQEQTSPVGPALAKALEQVNALLSITVNVQPDQPGYPGTTKSTPLSVTALQISLDPITALDLSIATSSIAYTD